MSQRNSGYKRKPNDFYATPRWVTEALIPHLPQGLNVWEPACGNGQMLDVLRRSYQASGTDIDSGQDFLASDLLLGATAIITNPPYNLATEFIEHALDLMQPVGGMVAMLLRTDFDHAKSRSHLFRDCPAFAKKLVLTKRIVWFVEADGKPKAAPSVNHAWLIWDWRHSGPPSIAYGPEAVDVRDAA